MMGLMPLIGLGLILARVPETGKQELEVSSAV
jgi:hypothetical protein